MFEPRDEAQRGGQAAPTGAAPSRHVPARDTHILDQLSAVLRHSRLILSVFPVVVTLFMWQSYATVPLYRAQARLLIDDERTVPLGGMTANKPVFWADPEPYYETQYRILSSRGLSQRSIRRLDLSRVPEFSGQAPPQYGPLEAIRQARGAIVATISSVGSTVLGWVRPAENEPPATGDALEAENATSEERAQIAAFIGRIQVAPVINTRLVDVHFVSSDPVFAATALNTHLDEYVRFNLDRRLESTASTLGWLGEELVKQQMIVEQSEQALASYRERQNAVSLDDDQNIVQARLNQLSDAVTRAQGERLQRETQWNQVQDLDPNSAEAASFPDIAADPGVRSVKADLAEYDAQLVAASGRYGARHPTIVKLRISIENATTRLREETARAIESIGNQYRAALSDENRLQAQLDEQMLAVQDLGRKEVGYSVLERGAESNRRVYESLLQQQKELQIIANSRANNVQLMDRAEPPVAPFTPNTRRDWFVAILAGLMMSLGLVRVFEYLDDTLKTPDDVARRLGLPLLGLVPAVRGHRVPVMSGPVPHDFGEAFRSLRTSLVFRSGDTSTQIIAVTSTQPLEGKTTSACNLAMVMALGGARVLLIDADMRRPSLHKSLGMTNSVGLSHVLAGQARVREAIQRTHDPNLFALTAGQPPPNPSELLSSDRMRSLLTSLDSGPFDWVIVDTPPVLAVTDAVIIAPLVSGVVFVVGAEMTRAGHAERAVEMLQTGADFSLLGVVLNRVDFDRNKYYYSRYYGYHYKSYYGDSSAAA